VTRAQAPAPSPASLPAARRDGDRRRPLEHRRVTFPAAAPPKLSPITQEPRRRLLGLLRDWHEVYRPAASPRCQKCGRLRIKHVVTVRRRADRAHFDGVMRCGLIWECPDCQGHIKAERALEVEKARAWHVERYGPDSAVMLTLTAAHYARHELEPLRAGVADAWRRFIQGRGWLELRQSAGLVGSIRALEVTHGPNGWHPHLHVVLFVRRPVGEPFRLAALARWQLAVRLALGAEHVPDDRHGAQLTTCDADARYLSKLGLELSAPATSKAAKGDNRTPLDILAAFVATGDCAEAELYRAYADAMKGARQLTWSKGLKTAAGIEDKTDEQLIAGDPGAEQEVARISGPQFDVLRTIPGALTDILELAEVGTEAAVFAYIDAVLAEYGRACATLAAERRA